LHEATRKYGKVDNSQVGVFAALSCGKFATLMDGRLYLPKEWVNDPERCNASNIPDESQVMKSKSDLENPQPAIPFILDRLAVIFLCLIMILVNPMPLTDPMIKRLRRDKLIEGRKPNFHVSASVAKVTASKVDYIRTRAQDDDY